MNISSTGPKVQKTTTSTAPQNAKPEQDAADAAEPNDGYQVTIELPAAPDIDLAKYAKYAGRIIPGTATLALNAPNILISPILNAADPATTSGDQLSYERIANIAGTSAIGAVVCGVLGSATGETAAGALAGGLLGAIGGIARVFVGSLLSDSPKYPEIGDSASVAKNSHSNKAHGAGAALRAGYGAAIREAYMDGGRYSDSSVDFARGLIGLDEK